MHDETDKIIYVGKAISLKNRVRQYFQSSRNKGAKIEQNGDSHFQVRVYRNRFGTGSAGAGV